MTNLLKIPKLLRMSNRNLSILHEISNHCNAVLVLLDLWAMRSVLNLQIDIDDTTKSRIVLKIISISHNPPFTKVGHQNVEGHHDMRCNQSHIKGTLNVV